MTWMPIARVDLHDLEDAVAFTIAAIGWARIPVADHEREDLIADGLAQLAAWADQWDPTRYGDGTGTFTGYAHTYLPRRLLQIWQRQQPGARRRLQPDGTRPYITPPPPIPLDDLNLDEINWRQLEYREHADTGERLHDPTDDLRLPPTITHAIHTIPTHLQTHASSILLHRHHGAGIRETARTIGVTTRTVLDVQAAIATALHIQ